MPRLLLARHGETTWNRERRVQGWAPVGLAETGREQARRLGRHLAAEYDVDRVRCSDLRRAVETARLATRELARGGAIATDAPPVCDPAWRERDFGVLQGLTRDALFDGHPEFAVDETGHWAVTATPEGGESLLDVRARVLRATADLRSELAAEETALVVTHGGPLRLVLGAALDLDLVASVVDLDPPNCSVTELWLEDDAALEDDATLEDDASLGPARDDPQSAGECDPRFAAAVTVERRAATPFLDAAAD